MADLLVPFLLGVIAGLWLLLERQKLDAARRETATWRHLTGEWEKHANHLANASAKNLENFARLTFAYIGLKHEKASPPAPAEPTSPEPQSDKVTG
jgi:hypothetical protein